MFLINVSFKTFHLHSKTHHKCSLNACFCLFLDKSLHNVQQSVKVLQPFGHKCTLPNEISLKANRYYDCGKDSVGALEDFNSKQHLVVKPILSPLALIIRGLVCNWKQPVEFYIANESTRSGHTISC